jgi:hypothetical protein
LPYRLFDSRSRDGVRDELFPDPRYHCCVIVGHAEDGPKRDFILRYNIWETDRYIAAMENFRFAAFFAGCSPGGFAELTQWESAAGFEQALQDPGFGEHLALGSHYATAEVSFLRVAAVAAA